MSCKYNAKLFSGNFQCPNDEFEHSNFCRFHHPTFWKEHKSEHDELVKDLIQKKLNAHHELYLVGYHIPEYKFPKTIHGNLHCEFAYFDTGVDFSYVEFYANVSFYYAVFEKVANFQFCKFDEVPIFYETTFKDDGVFVASVFSNGANFYESVFLKWAKFSNCHFGKSSFLPGMRCYDRATFQSTTFVGKTTMQRCEFVNANFSYVDFQGELELSNVKFPEIILKDVKRREFEIPIRFNYSTMRERVRIIGKSDKPVILEGVSFLGVNLQNVEFNNVKWLNPKHVWRKMIIDELTLKIKKNFEDVSNIYAQLRKNYETQLRFTESSNFFIGEQESIKKGLQNGTFREKLSSIPYSFYKYLSFYGESYFLPLAVWTPILIVSFFILRNQMEYCAVEDECHIVGRITDSLSSFFLFPRSNGLIDISERLLSIPILGSSFIGLKRKFERRK